MATNKQIAEIIHNEKKRKNVTEGIVPDLPDKPEEFKQPRTFI